VEWANTAAYAYSAYIELHVSWVIASFAKQGPGEERRCFALYAEQNTVF